MEGIPPACSTASSTPRMQVSLVGRHELALYRSVGPAIERTRMVLNGGRAGVARQGRGAGVGQVGHPVMQVMTTILLYFLKSATYFFSLLKMVCIILLFTSVLRFFALYAKFDHNATGVFILPLYNIYQICFYLSPFSVFPSLYDAAIVYLILNLKPLFTDLLALPVFHMHILVCI